MRLLNISFLLFVFLLFPISFSSYTVIYPGEVNELFSANDFLGVYESSHFTLLEISEMNKGNAKIVAEYKDRKVTHVPFVFGEEYVVPVENGLVWLSPSLKERFFMPFDSEVLYVHKSRDFYYVLTQQGIYKLEKEVSGTIETFNITSSFVFNKPTVTGVIRELPSSLAVLTDSHIYFLTLSNLTYITSYSVAPHLPYLEVYSSYVVMGDSYGNLYAYSPTYSKVLNTVEGSIFQVKKFSPYIVFVSSRMGIYLYSTSSLKTYGVPEFFFTNIIPIDMNDVVIVGRNSVYVLNPSYDQVIVQKDVGTNIISSTLVGDGLILLTSSNELIYFSKDELKQGCYISSPVFFQKIGYLDVAIEGYATSNAELRINNGPWQRINSSSGYFSVNLDPKKYDFGKLKIECRLLNQDDFHASITVFRSEDAPKGRFILKTQTILNQGELFNLSVVNQYNQSVKNFTVYLNKKKIKPENPLILELPPGDNILRFEKDGYYPATLKVKVIESPWFFYGKLVIFFVIIGVIAYFTLIRTHLLDKKIEEIKKKIEEKT